MSDELVAFLKAQLDAEEQVAKAATQGRWFWAEHDTSAFPQGDHSLLADEGGWKTCEYFCTWTGEENLHRGQPGKPGHEHRAASVVIGSWGHDAWGIDVADADAGHIARFDPAWVLAEVQAKRRIIELHSHAHPHECPEWAWQDPDHPEDPAETRTGWALDGACETLRLLALPYASCDGYRAEWAPTEEASRGQ